MLSYMLYIACSAGIYYYGHPLGRTKVTFLDLVPPVPLGASGDEKSPSVSVTGDPAGSMSADTHLFQIFFECRPLLRLIFFSLPSFFRCLLAPNALLYVPVFLSEIGGCGQAFPFLLLSQYIGVASCLPSLSPLYLPP